MIPAQVLDEIFDIIHTDTGIQFILENQRGTVPGYPYGTYKAGVANFEHQHQNSLVREEIDPENIELKKYEKSFTTVSVSLLDKTVSLALYEKTIDVLHWFKKYDNVQKLMASGVVPAFRGISVTDRTVYGDAFYIGKYGFDIRMEYTNEVVESIETIKSIDVEPTYIDPAENESGDEFTIGE